MNRSTKAHTLARGIGLCVVATLLGAPANVVPPPSVARAVTITVNTTDDELNSDEDCSLREAIQAANTNSAVDKCTAGQAHPNLDTITFSAATNGIPIVLVGAAGGPGAPGADTVGGSVDTSGFLNTPILGCTHRIHLPAVLR